MPIDINAVVAHPTRARAPLSITMPCGVEVAAQFPSLAVPDPASNAKALLGQFNSALAPLSPILKIVDLILAVVDALKAVPELVVNPGKLVSALERVIAGKDLLMKLLPPVAVPLMAVQFLDVMIEYMEGLDQLLASFELYEERIESMRQEVSRVPSLSAVIAASEESLDVQMESLELGMGPTEKIVRAVNLLLSMAGLPTIPSMGDLGRDPTGARVKVAETLKVLRDTRALIPV